MTDCVNQHPNSPAARFCKVCGEPLQVQPASPPPPQAIGPYPRRSEQQPRPSRNSPLAVGGIVAGAVLLIGLAVAVVPGVVEEASGPRIDVESPRAILMNSRDFDFDMVVDSEATSLLDQEFSFFGEDCAENIRLNSLLGRVQSSDEISFTSGDSLLQFVTFRQALVALPDESVAAEVVQEARDGSTRTSCESDYEYIGTRYYGTTSASTFGYDVEESVVYFAETEIDSTVLEATIQRIYVLIAQDEYVMMLIGSIDASTPYVRFGEVEEAVQFALDKAYGAEN